MKKKRPLVLGILVLVGVLSACSLVFFGPGALTGKSAEVVFHAEKKGSFRDLTESLEKEGVIFSAKAMRALAVWRKADRQLTSGVYVFSARSGLWEAVGKIKRGEAERVKVTLKEGDDLFDAAKAAWQSEAVGSETEFMEAVATDRILGKVRRRFQLAKLSTIEGFLYPDTYLVKKKFGMDDLVELALQRFESEIYKPWVAAGEKRDILQVLTAASLVEKETALPKERPVVASVLANRLARKEKLRYDPTVLYALKLDGKYGETQVGGRTVIRMSHLTHPSRWNTYWTPGLPPTPICSPTAESFRAAAKPAKTDFLFFVAKGAGSREHTFSRTYEEHLKAVAAYRLVEK